MSQSYCKRTKDFIWIAVQYRFTTNLCIIHIASCVNIHQAAREPDLVWASAYSSRKVPNRMQSLNCLFPSIGSQDMLLDAADERLAMLSLLNATNMSCASRTARFSPIHNIDEKIKMMSRIFHLRPYSSKKNMNTVQFPAKHSSEQGQSVRLQRIDGSLDRNLAKHGILSEIHTTP